MGSRKKVTERLTPEKLHILVHNDLLSVEQRLANQLRGVQNDLQQKISILYKDLKFVVDTVRDIDSRTKEMRSHQYQPSPAFMAEIAGYVKAAVAGNIPLGAAPLCAKCNAHRDANVHINEGFIGYHEYVPTANKPEDRSGVVSGGFPRQGFPQLNPMQDIHERLLKLAELERLMDERITNVARGAATVGTTELLVTRVVQLEKSHVTLGDAYLRRIEKLERRYSELVGKNQELEERANANRDALNTHVTLTRNTTDELEARVNAVLERLSLEKRRTGEGNVAMYAKAKKKR